jgi:cell wall-associated NlpC family hydrolase
MAHPVVRAVLAFAFQNLGAGYSMVDRFGPRSYDCSSFVYLAFGWAGVRVGQTTLAWLQDDSTMRRFEVTGRPARPGDVILVPRWVLNKHFGERGRGWTGFNHALIAVQTDDLTGRVTRVVDASGSLGVTLRPAPPYVHYPGVRLFRPR